MNEKTFAQAVNEDVIHEDEFNLDELKKKIDFDILRSIFDRIAKKTGVTKYRFPIQDRVYDFPSLLPENAGAGYFPLFNSIVIDTGGVTRQFTKLECKELSVLYTLIHEQVHAASTQWLTTGYSRAAENMYSYFNEGVTDKLALEITMEYIRATAFGGGETRMRHAMYDEPNTRGSFNVEYMLSTYPKEINLVDHMIDKISQTTEVPKDIVWHAIVRSMYEREEISDKTIKEGLDEIFFPGFTKLLKTATEDTKFLGPEPSIKQKLLDWIDKICHSQ